jgi:hypothetical protein
MAQSSPSGGGFLKKNVEKNQLSPIPKERGGVEFNEFK